MPRGAKGGIDMTADVNTFRTQLESTARHSGWAMTLRGILAVAFGIIAIRSPGVAAATFVIVFAAYAFADGILDFVFAAQLGRAGQRWGWYVFEGLASIAVGVIALAYSHLTLLALVVLVGLRAIAMGLFELIAALSGKGIDSRWLLGITGVLSILLGILLLASPVAGGMALLWTIGVYAIVFGVMLFAHGLHTLNAERREEHLHGPAATAG
jgi:uncharacterized membrane protein HdeD (DUF308 family)